MKFQQRFLVVMEEIQIVVVTGGDGGVFTIKSSIRVTEVGSGVDTFGIDSIRVGSEVATVSSSAC